MECLDCKRPLRPQRAPIEDHPGTVRHVARGLCHNCYQRHERNRTLNKFAPSKRTAAQGTAPEDGPKCGLCERPIRTGHRTIAERPGTVKGVKGHCYTCYPLVLRKVTPDTIARTRQELESYLSWRRPYRAKVTL